MHNIKIITSTTRQGRKGISVAKWITELAKQHDNFKVELLDLLHINLPLMDEPNHPAKRQYQHQHTKEWSKIIDEADGYIIVLSEYNHGFPAPIKNAIDYLAQEWMHKPVAFVSYGGISGGLRSTQMLKQVVVSLHMMPVVQQVTIPFFTTMINEAGEFHPNENIVNSAQHMFKALEHWSETLRPMRVK